MVLTNHGILDIINLGFYVPALPVTVYVAFKQGTSRKSGWIYLSLLAILRIIGAITGLVAINHPSQGLIECSAITYGIGVTPLLLALLGLLSRVNQSMSSPKFPPRVAHLISLPIMIGLVFSILGGTNEFNANPNTQNNGIHDLKIGTGIYAIMYIVLIGVSVLLFLSISVAKPTERVLLTAAMVSLPFFAVRVLYAVLTAYKRDITAFQTQSEATAAVATQGAMSVAMEFIIVTIFIFGALKALKVDAMIAKVQAKAGAMRDSLSQQEHQQYPNYSMPAAGYATHGFTQQAPFTGTR